MAKPQGLAGVVGSSRRNSKARGIGKACVEALEGRVLLAVTAGEYDTICSTYPGFNLPATMAQVNIIEITPSQLSVANLKGAIATAGSTMLPDLVVLRTTDTQNTITYASSADAISIDIPSAKGAISIVGFGSKPLTIDAANQSRAISVGSASSTTTVNLGCLTLTGGYNSSGYGGGVYQDHGTLNLTSVMISGNSTSGFYGGGVYQSYGTSSLTNVMISGNMASSGGGMYQYYGTSTLMNVTISANMARITGGGVYLISGTCTLRNTIVARNAARTNPDVYVVRSDATLSGLSNLIGDGSGQTSLVNGSGGNLVGSSASPIDPMLAEGTSFAVGLSPFASSPAIDAGDNSLIPMGISTDIYGTPRIQGTRANIGAVETVLPGMPGVTYVVTSLGDTIAADGVITLREALAAANSNQAVEDAPAGSYSSGDVIQFAPSVSGTIRTNGQSYRISGSVSIMGPGSGQLTIDGGGTSGVLDIRGMYDVNISGMTITGGNTEGGGGIYAAGSHLTLNQMVISRNTASGGGGGAFFYVCTSTLTNVTISGNTAPGGGGVDQGDGTMDLTNVTISGNTASQFGGGGVYRYAGTATLTNVTISGNRAYADNGGGVYQSSGTLVLRNTIVARNVAGAGPDVYQYSGSVLSGSNNLLGDGSGQGSLANRSNGNLVGSSTSPIDPKLAEGSGFGTGLSPMPGSPAIDAGDNSLIPTGISTDIYGAPRIQGAKVNIGAVETVLPGMPGVIYVVTSLADSIAADGMITLREAFAAANSNLAVGDAPAGSYSVGDVIAFAPGLSGSIYTNGQAYQISGTVSITGPGISQLTIDGGGTSGVLDIRGPYDVSISGMTITRGNAVEGGGIYAAYSRLTLNQMVVSGNTAANAGGGIYQNYGTSILTNVTISGNTAPVGGGVYLDTCTSALMNVTISGNTSSGKGGGVYGYGGTSILTNVTISGNTASGDGGGTYLDSGTWTLASVTISANTASGNGGGAYLHSGTSALTNVTISGNTASSNVGGGGLFQSYGTLNLTNVTISGNTGYFGGGLYQSYGTLNLTNVMISGNTATYGGGGGLCQSYGTSTLTNVTISGNAASGGGGVYQSYGTSTLTNVTVSGNTASSGGGGVCQYYETSTLINVTISANVALFGDGGGVSQANGTSTLTSVTISGNTAGSNGGGVYQYSGTLTLRNTIVAGNVAGTGPDVHQYSGSTLSGSNNLIGDGSGQSSLVNGGNGNLVGSSASPIDPMLAEGSGLGTGLSPMPGSPAIDAGDDSLIPMGISTDIYGAARIQGARVNIGAVETVLVGMPCVTYVVTSLADNIIADGVITLREALAAANSNQAVGDAPAGSYSMADVIQFAPSLSGSIYTDGRAYQISGTVSITGPGISQLTLNGAGTSGVLDIRGPYDVSISGMTITGGNGRIGGGIYASGSHLTLNQMMVSGNTAAIEGGGIYQNYGISYLTNVTISGNTATYGGGIYQNYGISYLTNVTISGNTASGDGGGVYLYSYSLPGTSTLRNTIVARNAAYTGSDVYQYGMGTLSGANNLIGNGLSGVDFSGGSSDNLVGDSSGPIDPLFVSMSGSDWTTWDLHLLATSPAVNAGNNAWIPIGVTTDITGGARIINGTVDMGAYEFDLAPTGLILSSSSIAEGQPSGSVVATLSATDSDVGDACTYSLVSGAGSADNASFTISGNELLTAASFDYEAKSSYSIRVRSTDQGGLWFEKVFTITVTDVDEIAPTVTAVYVRGSTWASGYLSFLAANLAGSSSTYGYSIPVGAGAAQLQTLPWRNLNRISLRFSEDVSIAQAQFAIVGSVGSYSISGFSYNSTDHVATWSLSAAIGPDKLYVAVPGSGSTPVTDAAGNILDGEWTSPSSYSQAGPTSSFPSGNGVAGGDFAFRFDVLPGDSTGGSLGKVNVADVAQTKSRSSLPVTISSYRSDFDGNNLVNVADVAYVKSKSSIYSLPVNPPVPPTFGLAFSQVSVLLSREYLLLGYVGR